MRQIKFFLALLILSQSIIFSQSGWVLQNSGTNKKVNTCFFINDLTGFAGGDSGTLLKTTNGGNYWLNIFNQPNYDVCAIYFLQNSGWAVIRDNRGNDSSYVLKTINYGISWNKYFTDTNTFYFNLADMQFLNNNTGYISKLNNVLKTTNGGINWSITLGQFISGLKFINSETGWVGGRPFIFYTTNGGITWNNQNLSYPHEYAVDICFVDSQTGFCNSRTWGTAGPLFCTTNGGTAWTLRVDLFSHEYSDVQFLNINTGYMLALNFTDYSIARTTTGGLNWSYYDFEPPEYLTKLFFSSINTGWVVGDSGIIMKTTTGGVPIGILPISTEIPADFSLSQNYPNPFNPVTKIRFDIGGKLAAQTLLSVYDILSREVSVLVNEQLKPGEYGVDFDGSNYPSGVYFYKLQAGDFTETKKMLILK